ncbi:hypothetical protein KC338_g271 [Hortaea werneckii]|nr:hypothetical protein KC338_g271 [Hortaea werneckii]
MLAALHASYTSSSVADCLAYFRLYIKLSLNKTVSCGTTPMCFRRLSMVVSWTSNRKTVDLPPPDSPTRAVVVPGLHRNCTSLYRISPSHDGISVASSLSTTVGFSLNSSSIRSDGPWSWVIKLSNRTKSPTCSCVHKSQRESDQILRFLVLLNRLVVAGEFVPFGVEVFDRLIRHHGVVLDGVLLPACVRSLSTNVCPPRSHPDGNIDVPKGNYSNHQGVIRVERDQEVDDRYAQVDKHRQHVKRNGLQELFLPRWNSRLSMCTCSKAATDNSRTQEPVRALKDAKDDVEADCSPRHGQMYGRKTVYARRYSHQLREGVSLGFSQPAGASTGPCGLPLAVPYPFAASPAAPLPAKTNKA